jgi:hypothetical protein
MGRIAGLTCACLAIDHHIRRCAPVLRRRGLEAGEALAEAGGDCRGEAGPTAGSGVRGGEFGGTRAVGVDPEGGGRGRVINC